MRQSSKYQGKQTYYAPTADIHRAYVHNIIDTDMDLDV